MKMFVQYIPGVSHLVSDEAIEKTMGDRIEWADTKGPMTLEERRAEYEKAESPISTTIKERSERMEKALMRAITDPGYLHALHLGKSVWGCAKCTIGHSNN